jgi:hypothetical protein
MPTCEHIPPGLLQGKVQGQTGTMAGSGNSPWHGIWNGDEAWVRSGESIAKARESLVCPGGISITLGIGQGGNYRAEAE